MRSTALKVCGLTRPADVALCNDLGVDFIGFIFVPASPRFIAPADVAPMPKGYAKRVGVITDASVDEVQTMMSCASLDYVQLHGGQEADFCRAVGPEKVIKVLWPEKCAPGELLRQVERFAPVCAYFLFDSGQGGGGSGCTFAWGALRGLGIPRPWFLAGGIRPENAHDAVRAASPFGLDVNSGVEASLGVKDADKIRSVFKVCSYRRKV